MSLIWILNLIPNFSIHLILIISVLSLVATEFFSFVPFISKYLTPIKVVAIIIMAFALYFEGAIGSNDLWQAKVNELTIKLAKAETQSAQVNTVLVETILTKENIIKDKQNELKIAINKYSTDECKLSNASVSLFNSSSQNELPTSTIASTTGTSEVKISELLNTVNDNNATYYKLVEHIKGWQSWYKEQKKIFDNVQ